MMSVNNHKRAITEAIRCMVITVSDTRNEETDKSGAASRSAFIHSKVSDVLLVLNCDRARNFQRRLPGKAW